MGTLPRATERFPYRPQRSESSRNAPKAGGRRQLETAAATATLGCKIPAPSAAVAASVHRARAWTTAAPPRPAPQPPSQAPSSHWPPRRGRPRPPSSLVAGFQGRGLFTRCRPISARASCATAQRELKKGLFPPPSPSSFLLFFSLPLFPSFPPFISPYLLSFPLFSISVDIS